MKKTFRYIRIEPKARPEICASFVLKVYKHKRNWYFKEHYSARPGDTEWFHGNCSTPDKFTEGKWRNGNCHWMDEAEVFAFLL